MPPQALGHVPVQDRAALHVLQAKLAQKQLRQPGQITIQLSNHLIWIHVMSLLILLASK